MNSNEHMQPLFTTHNEYEWVFMSALFAKVLKGISMRQRVDKVILYYNNKYLKIKQGIYKNGEDSVAFL